MNPKVSVCMISFNQAAFIAKALDSVLMQQVPFDYEIVIGDDCSTDGTAEMIRDYQRRWPGKFVPILRPKNVGMCRNFKDTVEHCRGEYVAFLEGDDYWTDPDKLRLQVAYLDEHRDCVICHHRVDYMSSPEGVKLREFPPQRYRVERPDPRMLALFNYIQTCSVVFRRKCLPDLGADFEDLRLGDWPLCVLLSQKGGIAYLDRTMAHYRIHSNNAWSSRPADYRLRGMEKMACYLEHRVGEDSKDLWRDTILAIAFKDFALAVKSASPVNSLKKLKHFVCRSVEFRKPFWTFTKLWRYILANRNVH